MRPRELARLALVCLCAGACVLAGARALQDAGLSRESVPGERALAARLAELDEDVRLTWFASPPSRWEGAYRHLEPALRELFATLERQGRGRVRCLRVDPESDPALAAHAAALGLAPFRARSVERDGWRETTLWSSLRITLGARGAAAIEGLSPEKLPWLCELLRADVEGLLAPRKPRVLLESPLALPGLERELALRADPVRGEFDARATLVTRPDLLLWIAPDAPDARHLAQIQELLERGTSVVIAGAGARTAPLLAGFGLLPGTQALRETPDPARPDAAAADDLVRSIGEDQDFRSMRGQPNGTLVFRDPQPLVPDPARLSELALDFHVLASSSERTRPGHATLAALLEPHDPWRGRLVLFAASTPFEDPWLGQDNYAHRALVDVLLSTLASSERLAFARVAAARPPPLVELSAIERTRARILVVGTLPLLLLAAWILARRRAASPVPGRARQVARSAALVLAGLALAGLLRAALPARAALDLTREGANRLPAELLELVEAAGSREQPIQATLLVSQDEALPSEYRPELRRLRELLDELAARSGALQPALERLDLRDPAARARLHELGLAPLRVSSARDESTLVREVAAQLVLTSRDRREVLAFPELTAFADLPFRLGFACQRLASGRGVHVAAACDRPRLSPAESQLDYQAHRLFAPGGSDVYSRARALLALYDFEVEPLVAETPLPAREPDLLVWLQPRRDSAPMLAELEHVLQSGGRALVAAQPFVVRSRERREGAHEPAWWPEPQYCDLERGFLAECGLQLDDALLFDAQCSPAELESRSVRGGGGTRLERTQGANPLFLRVAGAGLAPDEAAVRALGELQLPFAARIVLDRARLAARGLAARTLLSSSPRTWSLDWKGGDLPAEALASGEHAWLGAQELALRVRGRFGAAAAASEGELVLVGCSQMFQDGWIERAGCENGRFLVQSAATLTLPPRVAGLLARRNVTSGLPWIEPERRARLRAATLLAAPLLLGAAALAWQLARRRRRGGAR